MLSVAWFSGHFVSVGINMLAHEPGIDSLNTGTRYLRSESLVLVPAIKPLPATVGGFG